MSYMGNPFESKVSYEIENRSEAGEINQRFIDALLDIRDQLKADVSDIQPKFHNIAKLRLLTHSHGDPSEEKLAGRKMRLTEAVKNLREGVTKLESSEIVRQTDIDYLGQYSPTNKSIAFDSISRNIIKKARSIEDYPQVIHPFLYYLWENSVPERRFKVLVQHEYTHAVIYQNLPQEAFTNTQDYTLDRYAHAIDEGAAQAVNDIWGYEGTDLDYYEENQDLPREFFDKTEKAFIQGTQQVEKRSERIEEIRSRAIETISRVETGNSENPLGFIINGGSGDDFDEIKNAIRESESFSTHALYLLNIIPRDYLEDWHKRINYENKETNINILNQQLKITRKRCKRIDKFLSEKGQQLDEPEYGGLETFRDSLVEIVQLLEENPDLISDQDIEKAFKPSFLEHKNHREYENHIEVQLKIVKKALERVKEVEDDLEQLRNIRDKIKSFEEKREKIDHAEFHNTIRNFVSSTKIDRILKAFNKIEQELEQSKQKLMHAKDLL